LELNSFYDFYANNWISNVIIVVGASIIALLLAYLLPFFDNKICNKIGLNLQGGVSTSKNADKSAIIRKIILWVAFVVYLFFLFYLVFLARTPNPDYVVRNAGFSIFTMTWQDIELPEEEFIEFYLNVMVFIPMGYLLPYIFRWFRNHAWRRSLIMCFVSSIVIENLQLITKRGTYDTADVIADTFGGFIGIALYMHRAYTLTNPEWRKDFKYYKRWKKLAKNGVLFPFSKKLAINRVIIQATDEDEIWNFYVKDLGFQIKKIIIPKDVTQTNLLLSMGRTSLEVHCLNKQNDIPAQTIVLAHHNMDGIKRRLDKANITSECGTDPYTNHRTLTVMGPDNTKVIFLET